MSITNLRNHRFIEAIANGPILFDGAIGTLLYERGVFLNQCFEHTNLSQPNLVKQIHRDYLNAGAQVLTSNSFGANRMKLKKHQLQNQVEEINRSAVALAKEIAGDQAFVAGSVGPTGIDLDDLAQEKGIEAYNALKEQISILVDAGVDLICLETFMVLQELEMAVSIAKNFDVPVVALYTFQENGLGKEGQTPLLIAQRLAQAGADVIGSNCGGGPDMIFDVTSPMVQVGKPVLAQANGGRPELVEGRSIYTANPEFFSVFARRLLKAGVRLIGGCCGTTPDHIRKMAAAVKMLSKPQIEEINECEASIQPSKVALENRSHFGHLISKSKFVCSVELNPPMASFDLSKVISATQKLAQAGVTTINIADGPRASLRMSNLAMAQVIAQQTTISPILHVCCRDRSFLGLQSHILGAHVMGIRNLVIITGDPPKIGPYPHSSGVYDMDSIELLRVIKGYNAGIDPSGKEMEPTAFVCATGAEPAAIDYEREMKRLTLKQKAGADLVMTQPVYDADQLERFLQDTQNLGLPVMLGLCPLASYRNAVFLDQNVPGMQIPSHILERMRLADLNGEGAKEGVKIAREMLELVRHKIQGAYIMPPFGKYELALDVLSGYIEPTDISKAHQHQHCTCCVDDSVRNLSHCSKN